MDKNGNRIPRLSYAYPEVRRFVVNLLREVAGYDVDGICLLYNRRPPLVEYEPLLVEGFQAEYGKDPRKLDDADPRWLAYRARTLTQLHREVRQALDDEAERQGRRRFELSAVVLRDHEENMLYAMDLKAWIDEGLVDTIIPYTSAVFLDSTADSWDDPRDADYGNAVKCGLWHASAPATRRDVQETRGGAVRRRSRAPLLLGLPAGARRLHGVVERSAPPRTPGRARRLGRGRGTGPGYPQDGPTQGR